MSDKFDVYELLAVLIPGVLLACVIPLAFPAVAHSLAVVKYPDAFTVIALTAVSVFAGYLVQAVASFAEPLLNKTFGGRPSERALSKGLGDRYFSANEGARIKLKLVALVDANASDQELFNIAMQRAEATGSTRVPRFNALYAYQRALVVMNAIAIGLFLASFHAGLASRLTWKQNTGVLITMVVLLLLFWYRTKQRGIYFVREVLLCAERQISIPKP